MKRRPFALVSAFITIFGLIASARAQTAPPQTDAPPLALRDFVQRVLADHPALQRAQAELVAARARARGQARPLYNPAIELGYENALDNTKEVGLSQTLDVSGKRSARARVAKAGVSAAQARLAITRKALLGELLGALANYETARRALDLARTRVRLDQDFLALAEKRGRAGDLPQSELLTARLSLAGARAQESAADAALSRAQERLLAITALTPPARPLLEGLPPAAPASIDSVDVRSLPEIKLGEAAVAAARARIRVAKRNRIPDPTLGLSIGDQRSFSPLAGTESTTLFGLRLSVPLPVRNSFSAEVEASGADWSAAQQNYDDLLRRITARLKTSRQRYQVAFDAWQGWLGQGASPLEEQRALLQRLWHAGEINAVDYIVQLNQTFATENAAVDLKGRLWSAWFGWLDAAGTAREWVETIK